MTQQHMVVETNTVGIRTLMMTEKNANEKQCIFYDFFNGYSESLSFLCRVDCEDIWCMKFVAFAPGFTWGSNLLYGAPWGGLLLEKSGKGHPHQVGLLMAWKRGIFRLGFLCRWHVWFFGSVCYGLLLSILKDWHPQEERVLLPPATNDWSSRLHG